MPRGQSIKNFDQKSAREPPDGGGGAPLLLALGANLGDPVAQLALAVARLRELRLADAVSSVYRTEPVGFREQPDFYNLVCRGRTALAPGEVLRLARAVEEELGRERSFRDAPRRIDVDLLDLGGAVLRGPELTLPHPRLHERAFVLVPLAEVDPGWRHPVLGRTAAELLAARGAGERVERWGRLPG